MSRELLSLLSRDMLGTGVSLPGVPVLYLCLPAHCSRLTAKTLEQGFLVFRVRGTSRPQSLLLKP